MNLSSGIKNLFPFIKVISTVLIISAIGLELWNIQAVITNTHLPSSLNPVFWLERFALIAHLVEASIASYYAPTKNKMPIKYGTYTFFVGTVGLLELFEKN
ncbi:MAG TPA: hypothetical protein V6D28_03435 [Leptolyngbyaceae cyanobacterium]